MKNVSARIKGGNKWKPKALQYIHLSGIHGDDNELLTYIELHLSVKTYRMLGLEINNIEAQIKEPK